MKKVLVLATVFQLLLSSCGTSAAPNSYISPQQISEPQITEFTPIYEEQVERVNNCDSTNPTYTITYKTTEAQNASFEVSVGAGGLVQGTPIPEVLQVQLEAKIAAALKKDYGILTEKNHEIILQNPPKSNLMHTITWKVTKIKGLIDVAYDNGTAQVIFDKIADVELYDRVSEIISECPNVQVDNPPVETATIQQNVQTVNQETSFEVKANLPWQDTGITINPGDNLQITYSSGEWTGQSSVGGLSGPDYGFEANNTESCYPIKQEGSSLIAMIGNSTPFKIGYQFLGQKQERGSLFFRMNDCDKYLADNNGSIIVSIKIFR